MNAISTKLRSAQQAHAWMNGELWPAIKPWLLAGHTLILEVVDAKSRDQERLYHSCFRDLARDCLFHGQKADEETWKRSLLQAFYEATRGDPDFVNEWKGRAPRFIPTLDGDGFIQVNVESKRFTKRLASAFITFVHATGDQRGVRWSRTSLGRDVPEEITA